MSRKHLISMCVIVMSFITTELIAADDVSLFLVMSDISPYNRLTQEYDAYSHKLKTIPGYAIYSHPGIVVGADHFSYDHIDMTYETDYQSESIGLGVEVQVTKHAGSDSDKWLPHETEKGFRTYYGIPGDPFAMRVIDGNTIMVYGSAGWIYRWVSNSKVVSIEYHDTMMEKPEPLEVVKAYLAKHPSTLVPVTSADLRTIANKTTWIKDEMDRRLWLCDKWFMQLQLKKAEEKQVYKESVRSMNIFLDYRDKYYGIKAADEKNLLAGYLRANNGTGIKAKLTEYKNWWSVNKDKAISL